jgi:hypothetical protein
VKGNALEAGCEFNAASRKESGEMMGAGSLVTGSLREVNRRCYQRQVRLESSLEVDVASTNSR